VISYRGSGRGRGVIGHQSTVDGHDGEGEQEGSTVNSHWEEGGFVMGDREEEEKTEDGGRRAEGGGRAGGRASSLSWTAGIPACRWGDGMSRPLWTNVGGTPTLLEAPR